MERRDVLRAIGVTLAVASAGCSGERSPSGTTTTTGGTTINETTESTPTVGPAESLYNLGEAHSHEPWEIVVTHFELTTTFQTDSETYDMPEGRQLGIATVEVTNQSNEEEVWAGKSFAVISDETVTKEQVGFDHPDFGDPIAMDELKRIDHYRQFAPQGYPVSAGETATIWALFVLSVESSLDEMVVGFDGMDNDETTYPARWTGN